MLKRNLIQWVVLPAAIIAACGLVNQFAAGADPAPLIAHMDTYTSADGTTDFAISLKPAGVATSPGPHDVVVLFSTSASQTGEYRTKAMEALKGVLAGLAAGDLAQLVAVDLNAIPLTTTFVAPDGKEMAAALAALDARAPLGASDMEKAINSVVSVFAADSKNPRAAVYIGDGRSSANFLDTDKFVALSGKLAAARIPLNSFVLGGRTDARLAGALAVQTGGAVILDGDALKGEEAGRRLAAAANAAVLWPTTVGWPNEMEVFPKQLPPLRGDRETVVIGTLKGIGPLTIHVTADSAAGAQQLTFDVPPIVSDDNNSYLARLVGEARVDGGVTLPLVGSASLAEARQEINSGVRNFGRLAREALSSGDLTSAERLVDAALRGDPNDPEALAVKGALAKRQQGVPAKDAGKAVHTSPPPGTPEAGAAADLNLVGPTGERPPGALAGDIEDNRRVITQMMQTDVQDSLRKARSTMSVDPDVTTQDLKLTLEKVRQVPELNPDVRDQFVQAIQGALQETARRKIEMEHTRQQQLANSAAAQKRVVAAENLVRNEQKVKQLMDRFNSLMSEGRYLLAEEAGALEARKIVSGTPNPSPVPDLAALEARQVRYYRDFMKLREDRQKGVVDVLYQVEKAHVPFSDEPPILYPDAEVWQRLTARRKDKWSSVDLANPKPAEKKIRDALKSPTQLEFAETPLQDVIDYLKDYHQIEIQLDTRAISDAGVASDTPITKNLKGISLRSALRLLLKDHSLTYMIQDEVLLITTPEVAENNLVTKVYPVADLVIPVQSGMGGGMMGGMGGGMGMMNVLRELVPNIPPGGFKAFDVKDDLRLKPKTDATPAKTETPDKQDAPASIGNRPAKVEIKIPEGAKPETFWDQYFARNQPQPAAVREEVRRLMKEKKFDHVIALINAALRQRQAQPWMYEALSLALDAAGRPKAEIERAVMSAVDFIDNPADLMYIGTYLAQLGLNQRALQVYRQAAAVAPIRPEPYMLGLQAARAIDDLDGLKWASLGILGQAWPKEEEDTVWQAGVGVANEVLGKLRAENRSKEADEFQAAVDQAMQRDCVAIVTWTGEADLDLFVQEPSGTVCSLRNPRTAAGGILIGDTLTQTGRDSFGGHSQAYSCPKGFDGAYQMLVRRVWGNVTAGRVNVEVITHFRSPNAIDVSKKIPLEKDEAVIAFDLKDGRRKEPLREQQVASAAIGQLVLNRQILAQQLAAAVDPRVLQSLAASRGYDTGAADGAADGVAGGVPGGRFPIVGGGAVGYQPVISVLPEGANLMALAVISADRRYVRITPFPMFSGVGKVNTFNTASGATGSSSGTGSSGFSGSVCFGGLFRDVKDATDILFPYRGQQGAIVVVSVLPGSPAEKAGLCIGDIIYRFDGQPVPLNDTINSMREKVIPLKLEGGVTRTIGVLRGGVEMEIQVTWPRSNWVEPDDQIRDLPDQHSDGAV